MLLGKRRSELFLLINRLYPVVVINSSVTTVGQPAILCYKSKTDFYCIIPVTGWASMGFSRVKTDSKSMAERRLLLVSKASMASST